MSGTMANCTATDSQVKIVFDNEVDELTQEITRVIRLVQPSKTFGTGPESITTSFLEAMDQFQANSKTYGEKGNESYTEFGLKDMRIALFQALRSTPRETLREYIRNCMAQAEISRSNGNLDDAIQIELDIFRLAMQSRDHKEGKGERDISYFSLIELHKYKPRSVRGLIRLLPTKYGSWIDIVKLITLFEEEAKNVSKDELTEIFNTVKDMMLFIADTLRTDDKSDRPSLCAKWVPRENSQYSALARRLAIFMFQDEKYDNVKKTYLGQKSIANQKALDSEKRRLYGKYRKLVANLNKRIGTVEILQCDPSHRWSEINIGAIPAKHFKIRSKALQNKKVKVKRGELNDVRSTHPDRIKCAENVTEHFNKVKSGEVTMKTSGLFISEIVKRYYDGAEYDETYELQFQQIVNECENLDHFCAIADTSGSMMGDPIIVAISLAALIAKKSKYFANRYISFNTVPKFKMIDPDANLYTIVNQLKADNDWGGTTDFFQSMKLMMDVCSKYNVSKDEVSKMKLIVISDMQFDAANGSHSYYAKGPKWTDTSQRIKNGWLSIGYEEVPQIVYWNVRDSNKFIAQADTENVQMISGYNQRQLKILLMTGDASKCQGKQVTPIDTLRTAIDLPIYDDIIHTLANIGEGDFKHLQIVDNVNPVIEGAPGEPDRDLDIDVLQKRVDKIINK